MPALHYVRRFNLAERFKNLPQIGPCHITGQITYRDVHSVPLPSYGTPAFGDRAKQR
jgi:hypothetical protein